MTKITKKLAKKKPAKKAAAKPDYSARIAQVKIQHAANEAAYIRLALWDGRTSYERLDTLLKKLEDDLRT